MEKPGSTYPACALMQHALTSALRLTLLWRPSPARSYASDGAARGPEIQVRALAGPDKGECALPGSTREPAGASRSRAEEGAPRLALLRGPRRWPARPLCTERWRPVEGRRVAQCVSGFGPKSPASQSRLPENG